MKLNDVLVVNKYFGLKWILICSKFISSRRCMARKNLRSSIEIFFWHHFLCGLMQKSLTLRNRRFLWIGISILDRKVFCIKYGVVFVECLLDNRFLRDIENIWFRLWRFFGELTIWTAFGLLTFNACISPHKCF
jgi:hypothetical protein